MCELFAMSSRVPAAVTYSLHEFAENGSRQRHNRDGWGIAFARDRDAFLVKEPEPAVDSPWVNFIASQAIQTHVAIAHVRRASRGKHTMENTHPFRRALGKYTHFFAHNGTLKGIEKAVDQTTLSTRPIGETDSELAFCLLLTRLKPLYEKEETPPVEERTRVFAGVCREMKKLGTCNFLYFDGDCLFAHAHKRIYEEDGPAAEARPPGLHLKHGLTFGDEKKLSCPGLDVELEHQQTIFLASVPLDDHGWEALAEGTVLTIRGGEVLN